MKYNLSRLMKKAWSLYRQAAKKAAITFSTALKVAWQWLKARVANAEKVAQAAKEAGCGDIETHSWSGWQSLGRMVIHGSQALFKVTVDDPTTKSGTRVKSYFGIQQTEPLTA